jgi:hypothetical protein
MSELKSVAIVQSNYIPWIGYFDLISSVDEFVLLDDVQFTKRDWRNRNLIKSQTGPKWLTIPVATKGRFNQLVNETLVQGQEWREQHWATLVHAYGKSAFFNEISDLLGPLYKDGRSEFLSAINREFIVEISDFLNLNTTITTSSQYPLTNEPTERLVSICRAAGATTYVSGPAAKSYLDVSVFRRENIDVEWFEYPTYRQYPQMWGGFESNMSIVDMLFNLGEASLEQVLESGSRRISST